MSLQASLSCNLYSKLNCNVLPQTKLVKVWTIQKYSRDGFCVYFDLFL